MEPERNTSMVTKLLVFVAVAVVVLFLYIVWLVVSNQGAADLENRRQARLVRQQAQELRQLEGVADEIHKLGRLNRKTLLTVNCLLLIVPEERKGSDLNRCQEKAERQLRKGVGPGNGGNNDPPGNGGGTGDDRDPGDPEPPEPLPDPEPDPEPQPEPTPPAPTPEPTPEPICVVVLGQEICL